MKALSLCLILISTWDAWCSFNYVYGIEQTFNYFQVIGIFKIISQFIEEYFSLLSSYMSTYGELKYDAGEGTIMIVFNVWLYCWMLGDHCMMPACCNLESFNDPKTLCTKPIVYHLLATCLSTCCWQEPLWNPPPIFFWLLYAYFLLLQQCKNVHNTQ